MKKWKRAALVDLDTGEIVEHGRYISEKNNFENIQASRSNAKEEAFNKRFIWILYDKRKDFYRELKLQDIARYIYISTYISYDNMLIFSNKKPFDNKKLREKIPVSDNVYYTFHSFLFNNGYLKNKDGKIYVSDKNIRKGKLYRNGRKGSMRIFIAKFREIYKLSDPIEHYKLGYILKMIPYIDIEKNVLSKYPYGYHGKNSEFMELDILSEIFNYNKRNIKRLIISLENYSKEHGDILCIEQKDNTYRIEVSPELFYADTRSAYEYVIKKGDNLDE